MLLVVLLLLFEPVVAVECDLMELNHYFDCNGNHILDQVILYRTYGTTRERDIIDFYMLDKRESTWSEEFCKEWEIAYYDYLHDVVGMPGWMVAEVPPPNLPFNYGQMSCPDKVGSRWAVFCRMSGDDKSDSIYWVQSKTFQETFTDYDREIAYRKLVPLHLRWNYRTSLGRELWCEVGARRGRWRCE